MQDSMNYYRAIATVVELRKMKKKKVRILKTEKNLYRNILRIYKTSVFIFTCKVKVSVLFS